MVQIVAIGSSVVAMFLVSSCGVIVPIIFQMLGRRCRPGKGLRCSCLSCFCGEAGS